MAYPSRPDRLKKRSLTISVDSLTVDRINALVPATGERSARMRDWLEAGLVVMVGPDWRTVADRHIQAAAREEAVA